MKKASSSLFQNDEGTRGRGGVPDPWRATAVPFLFVWPAFRSSATDPSRWWGCRWAAAAVATRPAPTAEKKEHFKEKVPIEGTMICSIEAIKGWWAKKSKKQKKNKGQSWRGAAPLGRVKERRWIRCRASGGRRPRPCAASGRGTRRARGAAAGTGPAIWCSRRANPPSRASPSPPSSATRARCLAPKTTSTTRFTQRLAKSVQVSLGFPWFDTTWWTRDGYSWPLLDC